MEDQTKKPEKKKRPISSYGVLTHLLLNHTYQRVDFPQLKQNISVIADIESPTDGGRMMLDYIQTKLFPPSKRKNSLTLEYGEIFDTAKNFFTQEDSVITDLINTECLPVLVSERLFTIRRYLKSRGLAVKFYSHSKTRCPYGQMLGKLFPSFGIKLTPTMLIFKKVEYELSPTLKNYVYELDNQFSAFRPITRQEAIEFVEGLIAREYYGDDYRV